MSTAPEHNPPRDPLEGRPLGPAHLNCPLYKAPMSHVCRACGWWEGKWVNIGTTLEPKPVMQYRCDMGWAAAAGERISKEIDALHKASNSERNETHKMKQAVVAMVGMIAAEAGAAPALTQRVRGAMRETIERAEQLMLAPPEGEKVADPSGPSVPIIPPPPEVSDGA